MAAHRPRYGDVSRGPNHLLNPADIQTSGGRRIGERQAGRNDLLVQAVAVGARDDEAAVGDGGWLGDDRSVGRAHRDPREAAAGGLPDLRSQEPERELHEAVPEVDEHDVVVVAGTVVVERDRSQLPGDGMLKA
ncbi:MAG: hypothetical protein M3376_04065, partial [Actinomycetota bacterium]|nr:hypothetical protein [Actinomycetota bacterium]